MNHEIFGRVCQTQKLLKDNVDIKEPGYSCPKTTYPKLKRDIDSSKFVVKGKNDSVRKTTECFKGTTKLNRFVPDETPTLMNTAERFSHNQGLCLRSDEGLQTKQSDTGYVFGNKETAGIFQLGTPILSIPAKMYSLKKELIEAKSYIKELELKLKYHKENTEKNGTDYFLDLERETNDAEKQQDNINILKERINKLEQDRSESERKRRKLELKYDQLREITEFSIVEKEISEMKSDQLESNIKELKEQHEVLELEHKTKDVELQVNSENGIPSEHYDRQLENENKVLNNALLQLRDIYFTEQHNLEEARETIEVHKQEIKDLAHSHKRLQDLISTLKSDILDMHVTIDSLTESDILSFEGSEQNLSTERDMVKHAKALEVACKELELSDEIEVLREINSDGKKDNLANEIKGDVTKKPLIEMLRVVDDHRETLDKYRSLVKDLRSSNRNLYHALRSVTRERSKAVLEAESLKLRFHSRTKKNLQRHIAFDEAKIDLDIAYEQIKYCEVFFPDDFMSGNEYRALQVKMLLSRILKRLNLLSKFINIKHFEFSALSRTNKLQSMVFGTRFLLKLYALQKLLNTFSISLDNASIEILLSSSKYLDLLSVKNKEIDRYLESVCRNEIDNSKNLVSLNSTLQSLPQTLNINFCTGQQRTRLETDCSLKTIYTCSKLIDELLKCGANDSNEFTIRNLLNDTAIITIKSRFLMEHLRVEKDGERLCLNKTADIRLDYIADKIQRVMDQIILIHQKFSDVTGKLNQFYFSQMGNLIKLNDVSKVIQSISESFQSGENSEICEVDGCFMSCLSKWVKDKNAQKQKRIRELQRRAHFYQQKVSSLSQYLKATQEQKPCSCNKERIERQRNSDDYNKN